MVQWEKLSTSDWPGKGKETAFIACSNSSHIKEVVPDINQIIIKVSGTT
jgi:hypothetical protein